MTKALIRCRICIHEHKKVIEEPCCKYNEIQFKIFRYDNFFTPAKEESANKQNAQ